MSGEAITSQSPSSQVASQPLFDMHCHVDFCDNPRMIIQQAREVGLHIFATTTTPRDFIHFEKIAAARPYIVAGIGAHPWYIADGSILDNDLQLLDELIQTHVLIGEIGLDFSPKRCSDTAKAHQIAAFESICNAAAKASQNDGHKRILSIHAVQAADTVHDILTKTTALKNCICIYHWFSGSGTILTQAVHDGCYFSVNQKMLATRRGKSYAQQIPATQLLLETDMPYEGQTNVLATDIALHLQHTLQELIKLRRYCDTSDNLTVIINKNSQMLFTAALSTKS